MSSFLEMNSSAGEAEDKPMNEINTTPLVDVMLVLLIVFMITVPVAIHTVDVELPKVQNESTKTKPENINLSVNRDGQVFWNQTLMKSNDELLERFDAAARIKPQPEVHIRADQATQYQYVGRVIVDAQRKGIQKVGFITEPGGSGRR
jgi:biopolymer transport protein ExbD